MDRARLLTRSFRRPTFIAVLPRSVVLRPDERRRTFPRPQGRHSEAPSYDESVSSLTPQQEPETRHYEPDPPDGEYAYRDYEPIHPRGRLRELGRKLWAPIAAVGLLIFKFKALVLALFKFKLFVTSGSMLVSIAAYSWIRGWRFAVGFVVLLLVHELGHVLELRRQGIPASAPLFIPFLGAVVGLKKLPPDVWREAQVALAGPILGSLGALAFWIAGEATGSDLLVALAFTGFFLNLFNLLPVTPLDGGRAVGGRAPGALGQPAWQCCVGLTDRRRRTRSSSSSSSWAASRSGTGGGTGTSPAWSATTPSSRGSAPSSPSPTSGWSRCSRSR